MAGPAGFKRAPMIRPCLNVFSLLDHLTGSYQRGLDGAWYLNGGLSHTMGIAGRGNTFKTSFQKACSIRAAIRYNVEWYETYDSENSFGGVTRLQMFVDNITEAKGIDVLGLINADEPTWNISAASEETGDEWWKRYRDEAPNRKALKGKDLLTTVFTNYDGTFMKTPSPWILDVDSFTKLTITNVEKMHDKSNVGSSDLNTEAMKGAAAKSQMMSQLSNSAPVGNYFMTLTAHAGDEIKMDQYAPSHKKLSGLKGDIKIKGVPENYTFLTNNCFIATSSGPMLDKNTKLPLYPHPDKEIDHVGDTDLTAVKFEQLRGKGGPTGLHLDLIFSQTEGLLVGVTEFNFIREYAECYGVTVKGNNQGFTLDIYPDVFFTRKTLRKLLKEDPKFERAMSITAAFAWMRVHWFHLAQELRLSPGEIREKLLAQGYDMDEISAETVEYHYFQEHANIIKKPTLTAMTMIHMANGNYVAKFLKKHP